MATSSRRQLLAGSRCDERVAQLLDVQRTGEAMIGRVRAARQPDRIVAVGEHITVVDQHRWRPAEPQSVGIVICLDLASIEIEAELDGECFQVGICGLPVRAPIKDAADIARPAIATVRIPQRIPRGLHSTWIPSPHR